MYYFLPDLKSLELRGDLAKHFVTTRLKTGDEVFATNLCGDLAKIKILEIKKTPLQVSWTTIQQEKTQNTLQGEIFQSQIDKNYLDKMVELVPIMKISKIVLSPTDFSQKQNISLDRLKKILIKSCLQSHQTYLPEILVLDRKDFWQEIVKKEACVLHQNGKVLDSDILLTEVFKKPILVGPEGGWSLQEEEFFELHGLQKVSLGESIFPAWLAGYTWFAKIK